MPIPGVAKRIVKDLICRPHGVEIGRDSYVMLPRWFHNRRCIHIGENCWVGRFTVFHALVQQRSAAQCGTIRVANDVYVGSFSQVHAVSSVEIGDGSVLSEYVYVSDVAHGLNPRAGLIMQQALESKGPVKIGKHVFIGFGASILPGVVLGDHCVVGTRSVVTHSFPAFSMVAGAPARLIKVFDQAAGRWLSVGAA